MCITPEYICIHDSIYSSLLRYFLPELSDPHFQQEVSQEIEQDERMTYCRYIASDNSMKRQLLITLSKMYFDNDHDDLPVTISNLQCLIEEIQNLQAAEEDDFTRIINQECIKELHKMIDDYRAKITLEGNP